MDKTFWEIVSALATLCAIAATQWASNRARSKATAQMVEIHILVNNRMSLAMREIKSLRAYIQRNGLHLLGGEEVPPRLVEDLRKRPEPDA